jgi:hypothetical protein
MTLSPDLFRAILALDSYNRGYGYGLDVVAAGGSASQIGNVSIGLAPMNLAQA